MRVYIAGPMTGYPDYNYPAFDAKAREIEEWGHTPVNPTQIGQNEGWSHEDYMRAALTLLLTADGVVFLPGFERSKGAMLELTVSTALNMPIVEMP